MRRTVGQRAAGSEVRRLRAESTAPASRATVLAVRSSVNAGSVARGNQASGARTGGASTVRGGGAVRTSAPSSISAVSREKIVQLIDLLEEVRSGNTGV